MREGDPELAIRAAMEAVRNAKVLGSELKAGINTGHVIATGVGADSGSFRLLAGSVSNQARRLAARAGRGQILVSEATYRQTLRSFEFSPFLLEPEFSGESIRAYGVHRILPQPKKARGFRKLEVPMVGREGELTELENALTATVEGSGQIACLIGEAGVGKSRLVGELKRIALSRCGGALLWLEGRCLEMAVEAGYWPFKDMLRDYFGMRAVEDDCTRRNRITSSLEKLVRENRLTRQRSQEIGTFVGRIFRGRRLTEERDELDSSQYEQTKHGIFLAVRDLLIAIALRQPLVLVFEDLHWADSLSLDLLSFIMEGLPRRPVFLLCVYRPATVHRCRNLATIAGRKCPERCTAIDLKELDPAQSRELAESLARAAKLPEDAAGLILSKGQSNPFFLEEMTRLAIETDYYGAGESPDSTREVMPENVRSVILSRVDRLEERFKGVLAAAAVIGRLFQRQVLQSLMVTEIDLDDALSELEDRALIYEERAIPEVEYGFNHVLTQEAVYLSILPRRRRQLHERVAEAMESLYEHRLDEYCEQLAFHYARSGNRGKALRYHGNTKGAG